MVNLAFPEYLKAQCGEALRNAPTPLRGQTLLLAAALSLLVAQELEPSKESYLLYVPMGVGETPSIPLRARAVLPSVS